MGLVGVGGHEINFGCFNLMLSIRFNLVHIIALELAICSAGCTEPANKPVPVSGKVLIDGQPLAGGTIRFVPKEGRPASSSILADGGFDLAVESVDRMSVPGVLPGIYRVQVSASEIVDDETIRWMAPQRYADFRTSGLEVVVDKPVIDLVFELTSEGDEVLVTAEVPSPDVPPVPDASFEEASSEGTEP